MTSPWEMAAEVAQAMVCIALLDLATNRDGGSTAVITALDSAKAAIASGDTDRMRKALEELSGATTDRRKEA